MLWIYELLLCLCYFTIGRIVRYVGYLKSPVDGGCVTTVFRISQVVIKYSNIKSTTL